MQFRRTADTSWLRRWPVRPAARVQLVCLPHAGGGASAFRGWSALLPEAVELVVVQYPGREDRFGEPMVDRMTVLAERIAVDLAGVLDRPYVLFGHSMGSAVAYEVARALRALGLPAPRRLVASGREAPVRPRGGQVHLGDDDALVAELDRLGGTAAEILADPELRAAVLGYVRNDYRLIETYRPGPPEPLDCPVTVFTGDRDPELDAERAREWAALGDGRVDVVTFPGGHFYLGPQRTEVVTTLLRRIDPALAAHAPTAGDR
ncbi:alpha/beta fold hydrolase [Pseudonocardia sp. NPDC049635]|uniref:thioesterase II family protein n=1 Tax=Pseudonocardia sp. NPDC049635 TaxID=3155506 RepID=UPI0033EB2204